MKREARSSFSVAHCVDRKTPEPACWCIACFAIMLAVDFWDSSPSDGFLTSGHGASINSICPWICDWLCWDMYFVCQVLFVVLPQKAYKLFMLALRSVVSLCVSHVCGQAVWACQRLPPCSDAVEDAESFDPEAAMNFSKVSRGVAQGN